MSYTKKILNDLLADGFNMTIKRTASDKEVAKGVDVFGGKLKAVATADNATRFQLMNEDGDYIVLSKAAKWTTGNIGVDHRGYKFAIVSAEDLENDKDGNYLSWFEFDYYAGNTKSEVIEAKVFDGAGATAERFGSLFIQTLNKEIVLTVSETISASAESWAYITLVADNIVDPADLLTKAQFYRITKLAKGTEKDQLFAVLSCEKENNVGWIESVGNNLEAQWAVTVEGSNYVLKNRENPEYKATVSINALRENDDLEDNIYVYNGREIKIEAVPTAYTDGFYHLSKIKDERYKIGYHSDLFEGNAWINADKDGALELNREDYVELVAANAAADSVKIENTLGYYKDGEYKTSTVKSLRFPFYTFKTVAGKNFGLDGKEYSWAAKTASKLAIRKDGEYYNLVIVDGEKKKVLGKVYAGASPADGILREQGCLYDKTVNDLFAVDFSNRPEYRRLGATIENDGFTGKVDTAKFFRTNEVTNYYLFENSANLNTQGGERSLNFLGESHLSDLPKNAALPFLVDTAYVRNNTRKPLYMLAVRDQAWVEGEKEAPCTYSHDHMTDDGEITTDASKCFHRTKATPGYRKADYLVVLADSAKEVAEYKGRTRLAFVPATHFENDMLVIENSKYTGNKKEAKNDTIFLADDKNIQSESVATFAFRLVNPADATEGGEGDFIIETNTKNEKGELVTAFVGVLNTVPVLVNDAEDAAPFNVEKTSEKATANESIAASEVTVIAGEGNVTIAGATGKKVVISNILGQVVANTVIASDNATIAAPAGVVVVAVEGEAAVKAIVK
ncbi:MAG: hypothetical protein J6K31_09735 [Parabacteroides sp.]|nr:hypothetical protein [Parabacteroides sp.]